MTGRMAGDIFKPPNFMQQRENYQDHAVIGMKNRANEQAQAFASEAQVHGAGLASAGHIMEAEANAEAIIAAGQANGQAASFGGAMGAIGDIGGAMAGNLKLGQGLFG